MIKDFGDLQVGDRIHTVKSGKNTDETVEVTAVYEKHIPELMFEVEDEDGNVIEVSGNHLWYVETEIDRNYHSSRKKELKSLFGKLDKGVISKLEAIAKEEEDFETSLVDMITLVGYDPSFSEKINDSDIPALSMKSKLLIRKKEMALTRIAESLGHIAENNAVYEDSYTGEQIDHVSVRTYDARRFAQQILSASGIRKFAKEWPLTVGKVITTEKMFELSGNGADFVDCAQIDMFIPDSK